MRRLPLLAAAAALGLVGPLAGAGAAAVSAAELPRTGFEVSGGATWTTLEEEQAFLREVADQSDYASLQTLARTPQGRPINMVTLSARPRTQQQIAQGSSVLMLCLQHGNEPAGREGCLQQVRRMAFDPSKRMRQFLSQTTVMFITTANPDGRAANTRGNAAGVDVNRDHLALETLEGQTIARVIRDWKPDVLHDAHEYGGNRTLYNRDFIHLWPRNLNVDNRVYELAKSLSLDYIDPIVQAAGFTTGEYGIYNDPVTGAPVRQVAGDQDERILRNAAGLRHVSGLLVESLVNDFQNVGATANNLRRVSSQVAGMEATVAFVEDNRVQLERQTAAAERRAIQDGRQGNGPVFFDGADNDEPDPARVLASAPCGYLLSNAQYEQIAQTLDLHGIDVRQTRYGATVSMAQAASGLIPLLLDERANHEVVAATPLPCG